LTVNEDNTFARNAHEQNIDFRILMFPYPFTGSEDEQIEVEIVALSVPGETVRHFRTGKDGEASDHVIGRIIVEEVSPAWRIPAFVRRCSHF